MNRKGSEHSGKQFIEITLSGSKVRFTFVGYASGTPRENVKQMIMKAYSERIKK